ncbi:anillin-like isoform X2 [Ambystoma mexicanum]|uniref:anillin-like isoform X2 n=1 Tax=Ambystoma mexicanum TaxID=8296 RepID=UPI0037E8AF30
MTTERQPLKRLRSDDTNESSKKRRPTSSEEDENTDPLLSVGSYGSPKPGTSSTPRAEWVVKPDTPAIVSVKSRIQKLSSNAFETPIMINSRRHRDSAGEEYSSVGDLSNSLDSSASVGDHLSPFHVADQPVVKSVVTMFEKKQTPEMAPPASKPLDIHSEGMSAICVKLLKSQKETPSISNAIRMRRERDAELAMVRGALDVQNPWREAVIKQQRLKNTNNEEMVSDLDPVSPGIFEEDLNSNVHEEKSVSFLEVRLKRCSSEDIQDIRKRTSSPRKVTFASVTETIPSASYEGDSVESPFQKTSESEFDQSGEEQNQAMNSSALIDQIFNGVLDSEDSEPSEPNLSSHDRQQEDLPPLSVLSPLAKSINLESVVTPLNSVVLSLPEYSDDADHNATSESPLASLSFDTSPPYSIDAYRSLRRNLVQAGGEGTPCIKKPTLMSLSGGTPENALDGENLNLKDKIKLLNEEVTALQRIIQQTSRALNCCVDEEHGKGSREEAEAERLLLVSSEKHLALLNMLTRLKSTESPENAATQSEKRLEPCRASVTISDFRLPLKMDYLASVLHRTGKPSHYFLLLIRFGFHYIVATPLASVLCELSGDAIVFPTSVTLNDVSSTFEIDIEVYSMAPNGVAAAGDKRKSTRSKITPKKLLSSRKSSLASPACSPPTSNYIRTSNFLLVGSHTVSLDSLNKTKFPLDKIKFHGKVGRLLGAHFQDKVPFLSPLEGNIHLKLQCQNHSKVHHSGFLTMFDDVSGFGAWHRRWFVLTRNDLSYWTYPDQEKTKDPLGQINLFNCTSPLIEATSREFCARPNTLELITMRPQRVDDKETLVTQCRSTLCFTKNWLSADTKEERNEWMEKLNQALVDLRTWQSTSDKVARSHQCPPMDPCVSVTSLCAINDSSILVTPDSGQTDLIAPVRETEC